ncbi:hypothetical protein A3B18_03960 [Candidatus Giovannonibacteria bacterium RIFCSPLOWO2_01_FULL_46_13]|uniref:Uncharacterized protein n=1 Tax=Candidatus Giovannonibacteria bacterium RIFCSPLOWO2_01_FULL_46_13 TaxID=1798352 RepID=A0A1F5X4X6_9BACT|nr:MAG: hypothetical protein A3E35_00875 [Candidatus Giovannonibacteria bacterium RIFCSPHIGHO2_12_FULL_44_22]OGF82927.1 MAG: hypothetical protein A3B18_03960 [Candidatus Giovannonibacteria bacterium RIFCSPLOWO2_01_FULL_46_13]
MLSRQFTVKTLAAMDGAFKNLEMGNAEDFVRFWVALDRAKSKTLLPLLDMEQISIKIWLAIVHGVCAEPVLNIIAQCSIEPDGMLIGNLINALQNKNITMSVAARRVAERVLHKFLKENEFQEVRQFYERRFDT